MAGESPRYPIETLRRLRPPCPARVAGRVISDRPGAVLVRDATGTVWAAGAQAPVGAWVLADGQWSGHELQGARCILVNQARGSFPRFGGDWSWLQENDGRRLRYLHGRARLLRGVREFFEQRGYLEVETPTMVPSPGLDVHLDAFPVGGEDPPQWLITSPEYQMKRLLAGGVGSIYQICRCFRRGELGSLHEPEFTMVEWYRCFAGSEEVMHDTEQLVAHLAACVHDGSTIVPATGSPVETNPPWPRISVAEAFKKHAGVELSSVLPDEERFYRVLTEQVQPKLGITRPTFLTHWPASMAALARVFPESPHLADRFEAYISGVEICNGFGELIDPLEQRARLEADQKRRREEGKFEYPIDERFLGALEEGMPPAGGNALGFDRMVMLILGASNVQDVTSFCRSRT